MSNIVMNVSVTLFYTEGSTLEADRFVFSKDLSKEILRVISEDDVLKFAVESFEVNIEDAGKIITYLFLKFDESEFEQLHLRDAVIIAVYEALYSLDVRIDKGSVSIDPEDELKNALLLKKEAKYVIDHSHSIDRGELQ